MGKNYTLLASLELLKKKIQTDLVALRQELDVILLPIRFIRGNIFPRKLKCGKPQCKCANTDYRHESWYLAFSEDGINKVKYVEFQNARLLLPKATEYKRFRTARQTIAKTCRGLIKQINKIERIKTDSLEKAIKNAQKEGAKKTS